jgi:hypothetical protein
VEDAAPHLMQYLQIEKLVASVKLQFFINKSYNIFHPIYYKGQNKFSPYKRRQSVSSEAEKLMNRHTSVHDIRSYTIITTESYFQYYLISFSETILLS